MKLTAWLCHSIGIGTALHPLEKKEVRQRPTLPHTKCSTIGEEAFHGRVRDGNVWEPLLYGHRTNHVEPLCEDLV